MIMCYHVAENEQLLDIAEKGTLWVRGTEKVERLTFLASGCRSRDHLRADDERLKHHDQK